MSKAILVMDMPESCGTCYLARIVNGNRVMCSIDRITSRDMTEAMENKPDWCPLHPMPEKMQVCGKYPQTDGVVPSYKVGWNACIDAILRN